MSDIRVESKNGHPSSVSVFVDDVQIYPSRIQIDADANSTDLVRMVVDIPVYQIGLMVRGAKVDIAQETKDLLVGLGWTPPEGM